MNKVLSLILAGLTCVGCSADTESNVCIFDGRYEMGMIPTNGCGALSEFVYANNEEDECSYGDDIIALDGTHRSFYISCEAGDPVGECSGFGYSSDGCRWDVYMRRVQ